jgi:hypothetical protein
MIATFDVLKAQEAVIKLIAITAFFVWAVPSHWWMWAIVWTLLLAPYIYLLVKKYFFKKEAE